MVECFAFCWRGKGERGKEGGGRGVVKVGRLLHSGPAL